MHLVNGSRLAVESCFSTNFPFASGFYYAVGLYSVVESHLVAFLGIWSGEGEENAISCYLDVLHLPGDSLVDEESSGPVDSVFD